MASDIVPIELGLPQGDLVTLWAPRWREDGEEWEAFLGHGDALYAFTETAALTAFTRTATEHDLIDHPAWHFVPHLSAVDLAPTDDHQYDLVGVPELVAEELDTWAVHELADIVTIARSLADVCELDAVHEVLDAADGFELLHQGLLAFQGREGTRRWNALCDVVAERWDELLDAIDDVVAIPEVDGKELENARVELAEALELESDTSDSDDEDELADEEFAEESEEESDSEDEPATSDLEAEPTLWTELGIDPVRILSSHGEFYTLRCYLDEEPIFLGGVDENNTARIDVFRTPDALLEFLASTEAAEAPESNPGQPTSLSTVATWPELLAAAREGELDVEIEPENVYLLTGIDTDMAVGPARVDPTQLDLAVELLSDVAAWAEQVHEDESSVDRALRSSERLGWLVSFILRPNPQRLAPSPPFDAEIDAWQALISACEGRFREHVSSPSTPEL